MELFILRHAIAENPGPKFRTDSQRPLTDEGIQKMKDVAKGMLAMDLSFDLILTSPYLRTRQTADIVANIFDLKKKVAVTENLASIGGDPKRLVSEIDKHYKSRKSILIVGHEPYLSGLISMLMLGNKAGSINMKKAGLAKLTVYDLKYDQCATLEWLMTPKQIAELS
ncbi:MAG: phosphohistidine phosphatase SixA [Candidatus Omnitrophica bacterium]|nr:phosphohistidine phosphatase SixA [Candidatus Omnitrophota bacterium]